MSFYARAHPCRYDNSSDSVVIDYLWLFFRFANVGSWVHSLGFSPVVRRIREVGFVIDRLSIFSVWFADVVALFQSFGLISAFARSREAWKVIDCI